MFSTVPSTGTRLPEGCQHSSGIEARHILRGRHENDAIETNRLQERRERLTGARWQVEHHDIGISPVDEREQPADQQPDEGRVVGEEGLLLAGEKPQRHDAQAIAFKAGNCAVCGETMASGTIDSTRRQPRAAAPRA